MSEVRIIPIAGLPEIAAGDDLAAVIADAVVGIVEDGDILVVTHKVVSKAEGRTVPISDETHYRALVESEASDVLRRRGDLVITRTHHGFICANAGVDRSNTPRGTAVLLPEDPDRSAHRLRTMIERRTKRSLAVVVSDTFGRAWRRGVIDVAIGVSGLPAIVDLRGSIDGSGRELEVTEIAVVDEIAAAADLVMGKADRIPVAIVRGLAFSGEGRGSDLVRPADEDMFR